MLLKTRMGAGCSGSPFLTIITRCYQRPTYLEANMASLDCQTDTDFEQIFVIDEAGAGIHAANRAVAMPHVRGEYVLVLDDDDLLTDSEAIAELKAAAEPLPDLVIFKADHGKWGILPDASVWQQRPLWGHIGSCDFISRRSVWNQHRHCFGTPTAGDYHYLLAVWEAQPDVVWLDRQLAAVQRISNGARER